MESRLQLSLRRCSELLAFIKQGKDIEWINAVKSYVGDLAVGHEFMLSLPGLDCTLVIRAVDEKNREVAIISPEIIKNVEFLHGTAPQNTKQYYFASIEQQITYGDWKKASDRKTAQRSASKAETTTAATDDDDDPIDDFEKSFIAVSTY